jgi:hypothetical protein
MSEGRNKNRPSGNGKKLEMDEKERRELIVVL